jgi:hypothetical protein
VPNSGNHEDREHRPHDEDEVYGITTAETSRTEEITRRQRQYVVTMLVRAVAVVVVVLVPGISWPIKIGLCLAATIIPYVAVVRANGGPAQEKGPTNLVLAPPREELGSAQRGLPGSGEQTGFIKGDFFVKDEQAYGTGTGGGSHEGGASQASTADGYVRRAPLSDGATAEDGAADQNPDHPSPAHGTTAG